MQVIEMDKIVIFGATGMTGTCAVQEAVKKGLNVRAFVRDPTNLPDDLRNSVEVVQGDVLNYTDVLNAVKGVTGVVVVLGTRNCLKPTTVLSAGTSNIIKAMQESKVDVISACLSAFLFYEDDKVPKMFVDLNADHMRQLQVLKDSDRKYIAVLPPHIADQPSGEITVSHDTSPGRIVSKHDLAKFLVDSLTLPEHYGKVCGIATKQ